jgi:catabolite regulation protein CreA
MRAGLVVLSAAAAAMGCAGAQQIQQVPVRELRNGTSIVVTAVTDPVTGVTCYVSHAGVSCPPAPAEVKR